VNAEAPVLLLHGGGADERVLRDPKLRADSVVMDEFHYYADKERGVAWQLPLLALPGPSSAHERHAR